MKTPAPRGPVSSAMLNVLSGSPNTSQKEAASLHRLVATQVPESPDILEDEDLQLSLFCLYELHYGGLEGVDDRWEWEPGLIGIRQLLEAPFEQALRKIAALKSLPAASELNSDAVASLLFELAAQDTGPSVSRFVAKKASLDQLQEFLIHKSVYQLK